MTSLSKFLMFCFSCQVLWQYHHWFWSYDNFLYKELTRNQDIGNTLVWVLPNIWRLGWARDTKFGKNFSNEILQNAAKCQGYSFYRYQVIGNPPPPPPPPHAHTHTQIRVNLSSLCWYWVGAWQSDTNLVT